MTDDESELWEIVNGDGDVVFVGSYEAVMQEMQRRHEERQRRIHDRNAELQWRWEERGARDEDR